VGAGRKCRKRFIPNFTHPEKFCQYRYQPLTGGNVNNFWEEVILSDNRFP
jgi:hypothetical protein